MSPDESKALEARERRKVNGRLWRENNREKCREIVRRSMAKNRHKYRDRERKYDKERHWNNRDKRLNDQLEWRKNNRDRERQRCRAYRLANSEKKKEYEKAYRKVYNKRPDIRVKTAIRAVIRRAVFGRMPTRQAVEMLGCTSAQLVSHLDDQFQPGMTWENYGALSTESRTWQIDHIRPLSKVDFSNPDAVKRAYHFKNLQPLWAIDNLKKGNRSVFIVGSGGQMEWPPE